MVRNENLPWSNPEAIEGWRKRHQGQFQPGTRYLLGKPMHRDWLQAVLRNGRQGQHAAAALELAFIVRDKLKVEEEAFTGAMTQSRQTVRNHRVAIRGRCKSWRWVFLALSIFLWLWSHLSTDL
jgi:hypothetical protein